MISLAVVILFALQFQRVRQQEAVVLLSLYIVSGETADRGGADP
jgi:hypothetical protein